MFKEMLKEVVNGRQNAAVFCVFYLDGDAAAGAVIMHEDTQHVWDELRQVELELSAQSHYNLLDEEDDGVLHGVVWCPVLLQNKTKIQHISVN